MSMLMYLFKLFAALVLGATAAGLSLIPKKFERIVNKMMVMCLYFLLFGMGVKTGLIDDIDNKMSHIGIVSLGFAVFTTFGSALAVLFSGFVIMMFKQKKIRTSIVSDFNNAERVRTRLSKKQFLHIAAHLKDPLILIGIAIAGTLGAVHTEMFDWFTDSITESVLYLLLFFVGVQMVHGKVDMKILFKDPISILLPLLTVVGSLIGALLASLLFSFTISDGLAVGAGFGWYSLSGVMIAELGDSMLGSIAFLSNLFREALAFVLIPLLSGYGKFRAAISVCGATSMDVTLPMIEHHCGISYVPLSMIHGVILTILVPFLVPLMYSIR